ncbi:hypothetical protein SA58113_p20089 (plasmid) [Staphylococcus argenteus]|uniref:hypothetical protein n=1 Tax=Staphylococcus argenteus TaxID=985002 RepID=UPI000E32FCAA|nr:hypothetical protein [Staphylococcus argenteus]BBD87533.1 hypothetical protein SA58113_p20089 [Staphylococcus argenteus]
MLNLIETDITQIQYKDEEGKNHTYSIVPIVTLPEEKIEKVEGKERRLERLWNNFYKNVHKELEIIEDVKLDEDSNDIFSEYEEDQYAFVNFESLYALNERKRENYSIGLRYVEEADDFTYIAHPFSSEFVESLSIQNLETLDKDIPFEYIESARDNAIKEMQVMSKENERKLLEEEDINKRENNESTEEDELIEAEETTNRDLEDSIKEPEDKGSEDESIDLIDTSDNQESEKEEELDSTEVTQEEQSDISKLQNDLYNTIDNLVPRVYLEDINLDLEFRSAEENNHSAYSELENITIDNTKKARKRILEKLKEERQSIVDSLYRKASTSLYKKYTNIEKLFNFESPESEYNHEYLKIKQSYDNVLNSAESQREEKFAELTKKFERDMERRAKIAYEQEKAKIEREERPLVEQEADEFLNELRQNTEDIFEGQTNNLINDINMTYETRYHAIVDEVLDEYQSDIDNEANMFYKNAEESTAYIIEKHQRDMKEVQNKIQDIEKDHIQNQTEFDRRVEMEVERKTQSIREENNGFKKDNETMQDELERLRHQLKQNEGYIENLQLENRKKDERLRISESDVEHYKKQLLSHNQLGYERQNSNGNFNNVVAPQYNQETRGVGNERDNVVATEKVVAPLKEKIKHPLMITIYALSIGSIGLLGFSAIDDGSENQKSKYVTETQNNIDKFKKTNEAKYLGDNTTLTIKADNRLKPSTIESKDDKSVHVKSYDNKAYTLKK